MINSNYQAPSACSCLTSPSFCLSPLSSSSFFFLLASFPLSPSLLFCFPLLLSPFLSLSLSLFCLFQWKKNHRIYPLSKIITLLKCPSHAETYTDQCNLYQNSNVSHHRMRKMETPKFIRKHRRPQMPKAILKEKKTPKPEVLYFVISKYATKPQ